MNRRSVLASIGISLLGPLPFKRSAVSAAQTAKPVSAAEYAPFEAIAKKKGVRIYINQDPPTVAAAGASRIVPQALHLDMNMVRASIENAIARTKANQVLNQKLSRLLAGGTAVQQVEFVHGSGTYHFPEDIEHAIASAGKPLAASDAQCLTCLTVCWVVCTCQENSSQYCRDKCREVCTRHC
jgi:hypothetical protein